MKKCLILNQLEIAFSLSTLMQEEQRLDLKQEQGLMKTELELDPVTFGIVATLQMEGCN